MNNALSNWLGIHIYLLTEGESGWYCIIPNPQVIGLKPSGDPYINCTSKVTIVNLLNMEVD